MPAGSSISSGPDAARPAARPFTVEVDGVPVVGVLHVPPRSARESSSYPLASPSPAARPPRSARDPSPYLLASPSAAARQSSAGGPTWAVVVACHGLGASKDGDKYLLLARVLPEAGLALARFDFRGAGASGGSYRDATTASRIADLEAVLAHLAEHPGLSRRVGLLGSSMGGFVAWHVAHRRIQSGAAPLPVVSWNAPADLASLEAGEMSEATGLGPALIAEVRSGRLATAPAGVSHTLVVQGEADEVVSPAHGRRLFDRAREPRALHLIAGADHRLTDLAHRLEAVERSRRWMTQHLGE